MNPFRTATKLMGILATSLFFSTATYAQEPVEILSCEAKTIHTESEHVKLRIYFNPRNQAEIYAYYGTGISVVTSRPTVAPLLENRFDALDGVTWMSQRRHGSSARVYFEVDGRDENGKSTLRVALSNSRDNIVLEHCTLSPAIE